MTLLHVTLALFLVIGTLGHTSTPSCQGGTLQVTLTLLLVTLIFLIMLSVLQVTLALLVTSTPGHTGTQDIGTPQVTLALLVTLVLQVTL